MAKPQEKQKQSPEVRREKMLSSNSYRKRVKDSIELFRTYRINVHNDFDSKFIRKIAKNMAEHINVEDTRSSRIKDNNIETTFNEISAKPQKL